MKATRILCQMCRVGFLIAVVGNRDRKIYLSCENCGKALPDCVAKWTGKGINPAKPLPLKK